MIKVDNSLWYCSVVGGTERCDKSEVDVFCLGCEYLMAAVRR